MTDQMAVDPVEQERISRGELTDKEQFWFGLVMVFITLFSLSILLSSLFYFDLCTWERQNMHNPRKFLKMCVCYSMIELNCMSDQIRSDQSVPAEEGSGTGVRGMVWVQDFIQPHLGTV